MAEKSDPMLYAFAGAALGAIAVFFVMQYLQKTTVTEFTRDSSGRLTSIMERRM